MGFARMRVMGRPTALDLSVIDRAEALRLHGHREVANQFTDAWHALRLAEQQHKRGVSAAVEPAELQRLERAVAEAAVAFASVSQRVSALEKPSVISAVSPVARTRDEEARQEEA